MIPLSLQRVRANRLQARGVHEGVDVLLKSSGPPLIRLGHPMAFATYLRHVGAPIDCYLRQNSLPVLCDDPDLMVPLDNAWSFFATGEEHAGPMLGWQVGAYVGDNNLNARLLQQLETAPTLYLALQRLVEMSRSEATHLELGIYKRQNDILLYTHYSGRRDVPGHRMSQTYQLGLIVDLIRHFAGADWLPERIGLEQATVPTGLDELFPTSLALAQQPVGYVSVPRFNLHCAVHPADMKGSAIDHPVLFPSQDFVGTLRNVLKPYLPDGYPPAHFAAQLMGVSERTLARRLSQHGLTYGKLVDEVRYDVARMLLMDPDVRIGDVAATVGFEQQSNFTRMFHRISGQSPREFRKSVVYSHYPSSELSTA
jgi:AraC-like DNA-binding protein